MKRSEKALLMNAIESAERFVKSMSGSGFPPPEEAIACQLSNLRQAAEIVRLARASSGRAATRR